MMDSFDEKRGMVKKLLDMLKEHASNEVGSGLQKPEGEDDMHGVQVEKVEVLPDHEMDKSTPEHEVETKMIDEGKHTANMGYHTGGMVPDSPKGQPDKEGSAHEEASEPESERIAEGDITPMPGDKYPEAESEPPSMFASFLSKKKKK